MSAFPPEMITNILSRLPVKSLLRFRCVSKPWCDEIDCTYFINLHLRTSKAANSNIFRFRLGACDNTLCCINMNSEIAEFEIPFPNFDQFSVSGSANCLLLLQAYNYLKGHLILFNPSTRKQLALPDSHVPSPDINCEQSILGYDTIHDDYKVCRILSRESNNRRIYDARVYSLRSNLWRTIKDIDHMNVIYKGNYVFVNGAIHSIYEKRYPMNDRKIVGREIVALDIETEACCLLPLPESNDEDRISFRIDVHEGCLCVIKTIFKPLGHEWEEVWVMKEYGVKKSWNMLLSVAFPEYNLMEPFLYLKSSNEVMLRNNDSMSLVWHDLQTGSRRNFLTCRAPFRIPLRVHICLESLVPVDQKKKQQLRGKK